MLAPEHPRAAESRYASAQTAELSAASPTLSEAAPPHTNRCPPPHPPAQSELKASCRLTRTIDLMVGHLKVNSSLVICQLVTESSDCEDSHIELTFD